MLSPEESEAMIIPLGYLLPLLSFAILCLSFAYTPIPLYPEGVIAEGEGVIAEGEGVRQSEGDHPYTPSLMPKAKEIEDKITPS